MKKLIISISITLVLFSVGYFLMEENILTLKNTKVKNLIGKRAENIYMEKTDIIVLGLKQFISVTDKKLDFLLDKIDIDRLIREKQSETIILDYLNSDPYCTRIRVVNTNHEIVYSTSKNDIFRSKLEKDLYGDIFQEPPPDRSNLLVDPILENIIFYKSSSDNNKYRVLFYYTQDVLDSIFNRVDTLDYAGFIITTEKIILLNFPEIDISDRENLASLVQLISEQNKGALRILLRDYDKTVYYKRMPDTYTDWTVGVTVDTERLRITKIGTVILIIQALVVFSVLIFVFISIKQRRGPKAVTLTEREKEPAKTIERETLGVIQSAGETLSPLPQVKTGPKEATETEKTPPQSEPAKPVVTETASETPELVEPLETAVSAETPEAVEPLTTEAPLETPEPVEPVAAEAPVETPESFEAVDEVPTLEDGVISLSEIEEVTEVEEIGEAEVEFAEEVEEEIEASSDIEPAAEFLEPLEEKVTEEEHAQHIPLSVPELSEDSFIEEPEEFLETELAEEVAVEEPESAASLKDEVEVAESAQISAQVEIEEAEAVEDDIGALQAINEGLEKTLPELEKLVQASYSGEVSEQTAEDTQSAQGKTVEEEDQPPTVPEEIFREKEGVARDDELSHLISSIEEGEAEPAEPKSRLQTVLEEFIENSKISKAAVLLRDEQGVFSPSALVGISDETRKKLNFEGSERIFKNILDRGKILYIKDDVFLNTQLKRKFHTTDAFEIVGLIFAPLFSSGTVKGIIVACTSVGESINTKILLDKIKKLIKNIIGIIS